MTDLEPTETAAPAPRRDPSEIRDPLPQPLFSWRRLVIVLLLGVAAGCLVVAIRSGGGTTPSDDQVAIVSFTPTPGSRVIRQSTIGVVLRQGYDGRIAVNGVEIPEVQMEGAIAPDSEAWRRLSPTEREKGPRPNAKERVLYRPGPGKAVAELDTGEVQVTVRYWRVAEGEATASTFSYSIYAV
jgi:hypothetical protein